MSRFKIGETIHYMKDDRPKSAEIKGIAKYEGEIQSLHFSNIPKANQPVRIQYSVGGYDMIEEDKAFSTKQELMEHLFGGAPIPIPYKN